MNTAGMKPTTNQIISVRILTLINAGVPMSEAFDTVLGLGAYKRMVSTLYDELRALPVE